MITIKNKQYGISSFAIRIIGVIAMILGLNGQRLGYGYDWLEAFSWTSLTIFAFLLAEGVQLSSDKVLYVRRMAVFTVLSEFAFDMYYRGKPIYMPAFSVMPTLFYSLLCFCFLEWLREKAENVVLDILGVVLLCWLGYWLANIYNVALGGLGVLLCFTFYMATRVKYPKLLTLIVLLYMGFYVASGSVATVRVFGLQYPIAPQLFCFPALLFIWNYNGERGPNSLAIRIIYYLLYPAALMAFYVVKYIM